MHVFSLHHIIVLTPQEEKTRLVLFSYTEKASGFERATKPEAFVVFIIYQGNRKIPVIATIFPTKNNMMQKPIRSRMLMLAMASKGSAQNGQTTFQILSPQATPMMTFHGSMPKVLAAGSMNGA